MSATLTPNIVVGKCVAVSINGTLTYDKSGNLTRSCKGIIVTNARSGGYQQVKAGVKSSALDLTLVYNGDNPPAVYEGMEVTVIFDNLGYETAQGIANAGTTPAGLLLTSQYFISDLKDSWQTDADYTWNLTAMSTGVYTAVNTATGLTTTT